MSLQQNFCPEDGICYPPRKPPKIVQASLDDLPNLLPEVIVCPVSGHGMVEQIGILLNLLTSGYRPSLCLGASGGAIALALASSFNWDAKEMMNWLQKQPNAEALHPKLMGYLCALTDPSIYTVGSGLQVLFDRIGHGNAGPLIRQNEILISAYNDTEGYLEIFSTVSHEDSILHGLQGPLPIYGANCKINFLGELEGCAYSKKLQKVVEATSAVPIILPAIPICDNGKMNMFIDGGVSFPSPLNPVKAIKSDLNDILYLIPEDIENCVKHKPTTTAYEAGMNWVSQVSRSNYIHERAIYLNGLCAGKNSRLKKLDWRSSDLASALLTTEGRPRYVELFPRVNRSLPIQSDQNKNQMMQRILENLQGYNFRIYYV